MCIISFSYRQHPDYPLIVAANRDEFYHRAAQPLHPWTDMPIVAGRDEMQGGTWLGVNKPRFVAITNYRDPSLGDAGALSRGQIATDFLQSLETSAHFAKALQQNRTAYGPFNVLLFDGQALVHYNNVMNEITVVAPGIHCLSNATLNTPWPKVEQLKKRVGAIVAVKDFDEEALFAALRDQQQAPPEQLPSTGVPLALEKKLSSIFIQMEGYGTRCSTVVTFDGAHYTLTERTFEQGHFSSQVTATI